MDRFEFADLEHPGMNTLMTHRAYGRHAGEALRAVQAEASRLEGLLSRYLPGSDVGRLNASAGIGSVKVSSEALEVLTRSAAFSSLCGGIFDVTVGPLVDLWRKGREAAESPAEEAIRRVLPLVGFERLALNPSGQSAGLMRPGQSIDLGGIGKGYAADRFLKVFREHGVASAFTNIGGNVAALGGKPDGSPWNVGIRHPRLENRLLGLVRVSDRSVVTSGDYQRFFTDKQGRKRHHILNPRTGYPAGSGLISVTAVAENSMDADALSTMLFVAGMNGGLPLLRRFAGAEAILVDDELTAHVTAGLKGSFQAAEGIYTEFIN